MTCKTGHRRAAFSGILFTLLALLALWPHAVRADEHAGSRTENRTGAPVTDKARAAFMTVTVNNKTSREARVCLHYKNYPEEVWVTQGWWTARAAAETVFTIPSNNTAAYFFAADNEGGPGWWGGRPGEPGALRRAVIQEEFRVPDGEKPKGKKYRTVIMQRIRADGRIFVINLSGS